MFAGSIYPNNFKIRFLASSAAADFDPACIAQVTKLVLFRQRQAWLKFRKPSCQIPKSRSCLGIDLPSDAHEIVDPEKQRNLYIFIYQQMLFIDLSGEAEGILNQMEGYGQQTGSSSSGIKALKKRITRSVCSMM